MTEPAFLDLKTQILMVYSVLDVHNLIRCSSKIKVESNVDFNEVGQYYLKYSVEDIRYKGIYRYRTIIISEVGNE